MKPEIWNAIIKRSILLLILAGIIMFAISEGVYLLRKDRISRSPEVIELTIPLGTAQQVEQGRVVSDIPREMIFVVGDVLVVHNKDTEPHELGPLWIPPLRSASLNLDNASEYSYSCSFTPSKYLGLTVQEATTWKTRLLALWYGVPPLFMFFLVYSFLIWPINKEEKTSEANNQFQPEWGWRQYEDEEQLPPSSS